MQNSDGVRSLEGEEDKGNRDEIQDLKNNDLIQA